MENLKIIDQNLLMKAGDEVRTLSLRVSGAESMCSDEVESSTVNVTLCVLKGFDVSSLRVLD